MNISPEFRSPATATGEHLIDLYKIWKELAGAKFAPKRADIAPAKLRSLVPWTWIVDVIGQGTDFRFRIAGERVIGYMGRRYATHVLSDFKDASPFFATMHDAFSHCVSSKQPLVHGPLRAPAPGREHFEAEVLVLPLSEDGVHVSALCGGLEVWPYGTHFRKR
jgi:hypothetical protein